MGRSMRLVAGAVPGGSLWSRISLPASALACLASACLLAYATYGSYDRSRDVYERALARNADLFAGYLAALRRGEVPAAPSLVEDDGLGGGTRDTSAGAWGEILGPVDVGGRRVLILKASMALCERVAGLPAGRIEGVSVNGRADPATRGGACEADIESRRVKGYSPPPQSRNVLLAPVPGP